MKTVTLDVEIYPNYCCIGIKPISGGEAVFFEAYQNQEIPRARLRESLAKVRIVTFNGNHFDIHLVRAALAGATIFELYMMAELIIADKVKPWNLPDYGYNWTDTDFGFNHIDIFEVAPGRVSLKSYAARLNCKVLQDLPIEPGSWIEPDQIQLMKRYNEFDLDNTALLFKTLHEQIKLREAMTLEYSVDLKSKSDAQIAEAVFKSELSKLDVRVRKVSEKPAPFNYKAPRFIQFKNDDLKSLLELANNTTFHVQDSGKVLMPLDFTELQLQVDGLGYTVGIGGLHSKEKSVSYYDDNASEYLLIDRDVTSYYPSIILNQGLYPEHLTDKFLDVYRQLVRKRIEAKRNGDKVTADSLKIVINGSFGKFGDKYSVLYSPNLLIQVTLTGQLSLLMLIEMLGRAGHQVVSANTDGVVTRVKRSEYKSFAQVVAEWEFMTGFLTEETKYLSLNAKDVNNYIAVKENGQTKGKGLYANVSLAKNPANEVCVDAVHCYLSSLGESLIEDSIRECTDVSKFLTCRTVKGGAVKDDEYLGRVVRFYYSTATDTPIRYKTNGNKVPKSDGAMPMMVLADKIPDDLDYQRYIDEAYSILDAIGCKVVANA